jgi:L-iditol 2-dehydrogenase
MKAQVFLEPQKMTLEEVPIPKPGDDQVLVRVKATGICGSDVAYYFGNASLETATGKGPLILGHEFSAEVAEVGAIPKKLGLFKPGDRVTVDPVQYCNACRVCKQGYVNLCEKKAVLGVSTNGAFAEYCVSHFTGVHKIADSVSFEEAAMTEPLACATYGVKNMAITPGDFAVVFGAGAIGCMMTQLIKACGAGRVLVTDIVDYRLDVAKACRADLVVNTADKNSPHYKDNLKQYIADLTDGRFADAVITPTGSVDAMETALDVSGRRSRIVFFGLPSDTAQVRVPALKSILWDKTIRFSWLAPLVWPTSLEAIATGLVDLKPLMTHKMPLEKLIEAITKVRDKEGKVMKALVTP